MGFAALYPSYDARRCWTGVSAFPIQASSITITMPQMVNSVFPTA
jgi:hypothetical protein